MKEPVARGFARYMHCPNCDAGLLLSDAHYERCESCLYSWEHAPAVNGIESAESLRSLTPSERRAVHYGLDPLAFRTPLIVEGLDLILGKRT
jgi:hypothetical protein